MTRRTASTRSARLALAAALTTAALARSASAATYTWAAPTDGSWSTGFTPGTPASDFATGLVFVPGNYTAYNDLGDLNLNGLTFQNQGQDGNAITSGGFSQLIFGGANPAISVTGGSATVVQQIATGTAGLAIANGGGGNLTLNSMNLGTGVVSITNSGPGTTSLIDSYNGGPVFYGPNVTLNLANTGTGQLLVGNLGASTNVLNSGLNGTVNVTAGAVAFNGSTAGDLFSNGLILNVAAGASFNFNSNAEGMGGLTGAGTVIEGTAGLTFVAPGNRTFSGNITGTGTLTQNAPGTLTIGAANALSPNAVLSITNGTVNLAGNSQAVAGLSGGNTTGTLALGGSTLGINPVAGTLYSFGVGLTGAGNVVVGTPGAAGGTQQLLGANAYTGTTTVNGGTLRLNVGGLLGAGGSATTAAGATLIAVVPTDAAAGSYFNGAGAVVKEGTGNLTFGSTNANFAPSSVTVAAGTVTLDQRSDAGAKLGANVPLTLANGTLAVGGNAAASSAAFAGLTLGGTGTTGGAGAVVATNATVNLNGITRSPGATVDFQPAGTGAVTTSAALTNGILGGYATYAGGGFATVANGAVAPLATYAAALGTDATANVSLNANAALTAAAAANSLRLNAAVAVTFPAAATALNLSTGGLLVPAAVTGATSLGTTTVRGTLATPAGQDLVVTNFGTGTLTVNSNVVGTGGLTKSGPGPVALTGTNTYTGGTYLNGGTVTAANASLGAATSPVFLNGTTLALTTASVTFTGAIHPLTIGPAGATLNFASAETIQGNGLSGTGTLTKAGAGTLSVGSNASAFSGNVVVNAGVLRETSSQLGRATGLAMAAGTQFLINDDGTANFGIAPGAPVVFAGGVGPTGSTTPGALALTDQSPTSTTPGVAPNTTLTNPFTFLADTTIGVYNGSSIRTAQLTLPYTITGTGNLVKVGNGNLVLSAPNNAFGNGGAAVVVANGTLLLGVDNGVPVASNLQLGQTGVTTSGTFDLAGFNQAVAGFSTAGSGTANVVVNSGATTASTLTVNAAAGTSQTFVGQLGGGAVGSASGANFSLVKNGAGTLTLAGVNTFAGAATVNAGALRLVGGANNAPRPYAVNAGGTLVVNNTDPNAPLTATTFATAGNATLSFELTNGNPGSAGALAVSTPNGLTLNGPVAVTVGTAGTPLAVGTFPLVTYAGSIQGAGFAALGPLSLQSRAVGRLVNDTANHTIDLSVTGTDFVKYTGAVNGNWDVATTANFALNSSGAATTYLDQPSPDSVVFDDAAAGTHAVNLTTTLRPAAVTVNSNAGYTFGGAGSLAGTTGLTVNGALTLLTNNAYTGTTTINAGTIQLGNGGTTGSVGTGPVADNGALVVNRSDAVTIAGNVAGTGTVSTVGGGTTTLSGTNAVGGLTVSAGTLAIAGVTTLNGNAAGAGAIALPGGTLTLNGSAGTTVANAVSGTGNLVVTAPTATLAGPVAYSGTTTLGPNALLLTSDANGTLGGTLSGTGTVTKSGTGTLTLLGSSNGFTGTLNVSAGTVLLDDLGAGGDLGATSIVVNNGATFTFGPDGNVDFPENTFVTVNAGGTFNLQQSENYGGVVVNGGTYVAGYNASGFTTNADAAQGYNVSSGTFTTSGVGAASISSASASTTLDKYTDGTVTFAGAVTLGTPVVLNVHQGTLAFGAANFPATGTNPITLGDNGTTGTVALTGAGAAATVRPVVLAGGGGAFNVAAGGTVTLNGAVSGSAPLALTGPGTLVLNAANSYTGDTTVNAGTLLVTAAGTLPGNLAVNAGGRAAFNAAAGTTAAVNHTVGTLTVAAGGVAALTGGRSLLVTPSLSLAGTFDLGTGDLDVQNGNLRGLTTLVATGYAAGTFNGPAGILSSAAAADARHVTAVAVALDDDGTGNPLFAANAFDGTTPARTDVLVRYTYFGDANLDGRVNGIDYTRIDAGYAAARAGTPTTGWYAGDFNYDGRVDGSDYTLIDNAFDLQAASLAPSALVASSTAELAGSGGAAAVPEPATAGALAAAAAGLLGARRRRR